MKIYPIETGHFKLDGGAMFGVVPKVLWSKAYPADENNQITLSMRCLLVMDGDRKILINNGMGNKNKEKNIQYFSLNDEVNLLGSLRALNLEPDDITDVFLTHLHFDHCGGSIDIDEKGNLLPAFPNATYHVSKQQWEWAIHPNKREKPGYPPENLLPIYEHGKLKLFEQDGELFPGFRVKILNGHTIGQAIPFISYNGKTVVYTSDALPTSAHLPLPYIMSYDIQPLVSLDEKEALLNEAVDNDYILFFEHDHYVQACTLECTPNGVKLKDKLQITELA
ncbi:MAG: MBL fold metallo-hydrolase [Bacteroidales bacterium]|nr:MBL fold metallo-hydrolase [Bacteroidales bacterium]MDZ4203475.1 MBL fold metallo-hydrolase [Bacteroidales bacterium]